MRVPKAETDTRKGSAATTTLVEVEKAQLPWQRDFFTYKSRVTSCCVVCVSPGLTDKTFLMTLVKFRNKNWTLLESKKTPRMKSMEGSCGVFRVIVWTVRGHGVTMIGLGFHARAWDRLCCPYFGLMRNCRTNLMEQAIVGLEDLVPRIYPTSIFHRWHRWWQFRMQLRRAVSDSCGV